MMKKYKNKLIISSLVIFLPTIIGLIMWDKLPDTMVTHWGMDGTADGFSPKIIAITMVDAVAANIKPTAAVIIAPTEARSVSRR